MIVDKKTITQGVLRYWDIDIFLRGIRKYSLVSIFPQKLKDARGGIIFLIMEYTIYRIIEYKKYLYMIFFL